MDWIRKCTPNIEKKGDLKIVLENLRKILEIKDK